ncbi:hypothetical protein F8388_003049 [Cannabis sativa]|uniref:Transposase MuDR plant domain-containing protein n=1 Tax=Cannabis sativa TaxID=3483 RepID=A0A7J6HDQ1_CANSA|nr:hypothetical protein F8388_003049 [Cannabis sativa]
MAFCHRGEEDPPPDYMGSSFNGLFWGLWSISCTVVGYDIKVEGLNLDNFTVKFFHGGYWFTRGGNRKYENGRIVYFDFGNFNGFSRLHLEEMVQVLGYIFPFSFMFKPKGKSLNMGFRVFEEIEWRLDEDAVRHVPQPQPAKLDKCILEELSSYNELVPDVVVNPRGHHDPNDEFYNKCGNDGSTRSPEVEITGYKEVEESPRARRLRQRRRNPTKSQKTKTEEELQIPPPPHTETQLETQPQPEPDILTQPEYEFPSQSTQPDPQTQPDSHPEPQTQQEADFVLHEEEYYGEPEVERHGYTQPDNCDWWGRHTELVPDVLYEDEGDIGEEDEMGSVHSDEENEGGGRYKLPYNPETNFENLVWKPYMEFASIEVLRKTIKAYFIHENKEYILLANDSKKFRVKCRAEGCPWMLYAYVKQDGKKFRVNKCKPKHENCGIVLDNRHITTQWLAEQFRDTFRLHPSIEYKSFLEIVKDTKYSMNKGGRPPIQNPNKETLKRRKRRETEKARKARQAAECGGAGLAEAGGSNT